MDILFGKIVYFRILGPIWEWRAHGNVKRGELPTLCSPAEHGRRSRVPRRAPGRLGENTEMESRAGWPHLPTAYTTLMGQAQLVETYKTPNIIELGTVRAGEGYSGTGPLIEKPGSREEDRLATCHRAA